MMKLINSMLLIFLFTNLLIAQPERQNKERIDAIKVSFITERMDLSPAEAQLFWPLYNELEKKREAIRTSREAGTSKLRKTDLTALSENELSELIETQINSKIKEAQLIKEYYPLFKKAVGIQKTALFLKAEEEFHRELFKRLRHEGKPSRR